MSTTVVSPNGSSSTPSNSSMPGTTFMSPSSSCGTNDIQQRSVLPQHAFDGHLDAPNATTGTPSAQHHHHQHHDHHHRISDFEASVSIAKAIMGAGSFALPWAFSMMGYVAGPIFLAVLCIMSVSSIKLLVQCSRNVKVSMINDNNKDVRQSSEQEMTPLTQSIDSWSSMEVLERSSSNGSASSNSNHRGQPHDRQTAQRRRSSPSSSSSGARLSPRTVKQKQKEQESHVSHLQHQPAAAAAVSSSHQHQLSYVDVAKDSFGIIGARLAYGASFSASIGVCGSYLIFIAENLQSLLRLWLNDDNDDSDNAAQQSSSFWLSTTFLIWVIILPIAVLLSSIRDMKHFAFSSLLGDVSVLLGMVVVLIYGLQLRSSLSIADASHEPSSSLGFDTASSAAASTRTTTTLGCVAVGTSWSQMALAFGSIGYLFLIHFLVLPIEASMAQPQHFDTVVDRTFTLCAVLSGSFGVIGYFMFGNDTEQIVLLNVKGSSNFVSAVQLLLCVDLLLTYPVVMRPSIVIVEQTLAARRSRMGGTVERSSSSSSPTTTTTTVTTVVHMAVCIVLGMVAASASTFVPAFGLLSGLVGGVSQTFLAFVLPPLMLAVQRQRRQDERLRYYDREEATNSHLEKDATNLDDHVPKFRHILLMLSWKERSLVLCGLVLVVWTIHSTLSA